MKRHIKICRYNDKCRYEEKFEYKRIESMQPKDVPDQVNELERKVEELVEYQQKADVTLKYIKIYCEENFKSKTKLKP